MPKTQFYLTSPKRYKTPVKKDQKGDRKFKFNRTPHSIKFYRNKFNTDHSTKQTKEKITIAMKRLKNLNCVFNLSYKAFSKPEQLAHKKTTKQFQNEEYALQKILRNLIEKEKKEANLMKKKNNKTTNSHQLNTNRDCNLESTCNIL